MWHDMFLMFVSLLYVMQWQGGGMGHKDAMFVVCFFLWERGIIGHKGIGQGGKCQT